MGYESKFGGRFMYKKCAMLFFLYNLVFVLAVLCVQGISIDKKVAEAFRISNGGETLIRMTSYGGRSKEQSSTQRVLEANTITKERNLFVTQSEYDNLLRIVEAEAGGEDIVGKMLVANVVLNRVENTAFPNTINEVIFQSDNGVTQFSPIADGRFYTVKISEETVEAVNRVLQGEDNSKGALYFAARKSANQENMKWFDEKLQRLFAHGGHEFFF